MTIKNAVLHGHASIPTGSQLVQRARDLSTFFSEQAAEAERLRRPTDAAIEALKKAQIFELMTPRIYGGAELDLDTFFEVGLALSEGDASLAWVSNFYMCGSSPSFLRPFKTRSLLKREHRSPRQCCRPMVG